MNVIAIEDETLLLDALELAIQTAEPNAEIRSFRDAEEALGWDGVDNAEVAFIDIKLPGMTGTDAARLLRESNPTMNIIFVTSYSSYMKDALDMHASGYITKPVSPEKVRGELSCLRFPVTGAQGDAHCAPRLSVHCFGNFEVFVDGNPLACTSSRSIELFAYLIDRQGARCSVGEIEAALWGNRPRTPSRQSHLRNLLADLSRSLKEAGCEGVLIRQYGYIGLETSRISCDYWDYLADKPGTANLFRGEYMSQYSWAETTLGRLINFG